jgi:hypothetical protein
LADAPLRPPTAIDDAPGENATAVPADDALLVEEVDLEPEIRQRVLALHRELGQIDHYSLLRIDPAADRKAVKRAYFELAAIFHPDKYFRKRLGSFKPRMEALFSRITLAHDVLANKESRAEYDTYLEEQRRARGMEELLSGADAEARRAVETIEREIQAAEIGRSSSAPSPSTSPSASRPPPTAADVAARREALARKLLGGRTPGPPSVRSMPSPAAAPVLNPQPTAAEAVEALRRRYLDRIAQAKVAQARKYVAQADESLAAGDAIAAANALRVASGLAPSDPALQARAAEAQQKADTLLGETYVNQAQYEEKRGQWAEAARSWTKATRGRPNDVVAHERAANAIVKAGGDLHEAGRLARRACELGPSIALSRATLATVYLAAGLELNARRELEAAAQLAPQDDTIRTMLEKLTNAT